MQPSATFGLRRTLYVYNNARSFTTSSKRMDPSLESAQTRSFFAICTLRRISTPFTNSTRARIINLSSRTYRFIRGVFHQNFTHLMTFQQRQQSCVRLGRMYARDHANIHVIQYDDSRTRFSCCSSQRIRPPLYHGQSGALPTSNSRFHHGTHQCMYASLLYHLDVAADGRHCIDTRRLRWQNFFGLSHFVPSLHGRHYCFLF